jgi:hypothetical protein
MARLGLAWLGSSMSHGRQKEPRGGACPPRGAVLNQNAGRVRSDLFTPG